MPFLAFRNGRLPQRSTGHLYRMLLHTFPPMQDQDHSTLSVGVRCFHDVAVPSPQSQWGSLV